MPGVARKDVRAAFKTLPVPKFPLHGGWRCCPSLAAPSVATPSAMIYQPRGASARRPLSQGLVAPRLLRAEKCSPWGPGCRRGPGWRGAGLCWMRCCKVRARGAARGHGDGGTR